MHEAFIIAKAPWEQELYGLWGIEQDKSVVSYLPVPFANLSNLLGEEEQKLDDEQKINYSNIHLDLMNLAEIYLSLKADKESIFTNSAACFTLYGVHMHCPPCNLILSWGRPENSCGRFA